MQNHLVGCKGKTTELGEIFLENMSEIKSSFIHKKKMLRLYQAVIWVGSVVILISFMMAIFNNQRFAARTYMRNFLFCPLSGLLISINTILSKLFFVYSNSFLYSIQFSLDLLYLAFWAHFFLNVFINRNDLLKIKILFFSTFLIAVALYIFSNHQQANLHLLSVMNLCNTISCTFFYYKLFKNVPDQDIKFEPSFWVIAGLFFYSALSLPFYALNDYIKATFPLIASDIFAISNVMIIIMHFFFIKAYICTIRLYKE